MSRRFKQLTRLDALGTMGQLGAAPVQPLRYVNWAFNPLGTRMQLSGIGLLDGALGNALFPGVDFQNDDAMNDFVGGVTLNGPAGVWGGVPASMIQQANAAFADAAGTSDPARQAVVEAFKRKASYFAQQAGQFQHFFGAPRSNSQDMQYKAAMQGLKTEIARFISTYRALPPYKEPAYSDSTSTAAAGSGSGPGSDATGGRSAANQAGIMSGGSSRMVAIIGGGLVLITAVAAMIHFGKK